MNIIIKNKLILFLIAGNWFGLMNLQAEIKNWPLYRLQIGIQQCDTGYINEALEQGINVNDPLSENGTDFKPLHDACSRLCGLEVIELLLKAGADINAKAGHMTPLLYAINSMRGGNESKINRVIPVVNFLLDHKDIDLEAQLESAFEYTLWDGFAMKNMDAWVQIAEILARKKPDFYLSRNTFDRLKLRAKHNKEWLLLQMRFDDKTYQFDFGNDLYYAAKANDIDRVRRLIEDENTDINCQYKDGNTPFMLACKLGHIKIIELFLKDSRLDLDIKNNEGYTAFDIMSFFNGRFKDLFVAILLKDLDKVREVVEYSHGYFGYWGSCTPDKQLALEIAKTIDATSIYNYLSEVWGIPSEDSWKSKAIDLMDLACSWHLNNI